MHRQTLSSPVPCLQVGLKFLMAYEQDELMAQQDLEYQEQCASPLIKDMEGDDVDTQAEAPRRTSLEVGGKGRGIDAGRSRLAVQGSVHGRVRRSGYLKVWGAAGYRELVILVVY